MKRPRFLLFPIAIIVVLFVMACVPGYPPLSRLQRYALIPAALITVAEIWLVWLAMRNVARDPTPARDRPRSPCARLRLICDWLPSPVLRKRLTKLLADQERHIEKLLRQGRVTAAHWIRLTTWVWFLGYVVSGTLGALIEPLLRRRSE